MHPVTQRPFLPYLFPRKGKDRAVGDIQQIQICDNLSVSLRLPAPLEGEPSAYSFCIK